MTGKQLKRINQLKDGEITLVRHFKEKDGKKHRWYLVNKVCVRATNDNEGYDVVYTPLYGDTSISYTRDIEEFSSLVDAKKHPEYKGEWRMTSYQELEKELGNDTAASIFNEEVDSDIISEFLRGTKLLNKILKINY